MENKESNPMNFDYLDLFKNVIQQEADALLRIKETFDEDQIKSLISQFDYLRSSNAEFIICGVGKSGIIAQKMVSTFNSIGLKSSFLHPVEALHGDLGRLTDKDVMAFISKSGTTEEIVKLLPYLPVPKERRIGLLGNISSKIAKECSIVFDCSVEKEACVNNQAPTTSSTTALAVGDAIAVVFEKYTGLSKEGFATNHPGGLLGKSLRLKVSNLMVSSAECAKISLTDTLQDAIVAMTEYPTGLCAVIELQEFKGILVEGDIRRTLASKDSNDSLGTKISDIFNSSPTSVNSNDLAMKALELMEGGDRPFSVLPVVDDGEFKGVLRLHDLLKEGLSR